MTKNQMIPCLQPVINYVKSDIRHLISSVRWIEASSEAKEEG